MNDTTAITAENVDTTKWLIATREAQAKAQALCKGSYQEDLVLGFENLSGGTLKGKAAKYGARYQESRVALIARLHRAGIEVHELTGKRGKRILVLGLSIEAAREIYVAEGAW